MKLSELSDSLPNGLHDAKLSRTTIDYTTRMVVLNVELLMGGPEDSDPEKRQPATITIEGMEFVVMQHPDPNYLKVGSTLDLADFDFDPERDPKVAELAKTLPRDCFLLCLFVNEWNSDLYIAGRTAQVELQNT